MRYPANKLTKQLIHIVFLFFGTDALIAFW